MASGNYRPGVADGAIPRKQPYNAIRTFLQLQGLAECLVLDEDLHHQIIRVESEKPCKIDVHLTLN